VTINDIIHDGHRRPFEIFINSKNMDHYAWVVALTRMISAVFRRAGEVTFVVEELKAVFDPRGGQWQNGRYVPSLIAAIGGILERHMIETGFMVPEETGFSPAVPQAQTHTHQLGELCPRCNQPGLVKQDGCLTCQHCAWSKCS
jgi:ribonucleoside-diphosphate reductase alpha chain